MRVFCRSSHLDTSRWVRPYGQPTEIINWYIFTVGVSEGWCIFFSVEFCEYIFMFSDDDDERRPQAANISPYLCVYGWLVGSVKVFEREWEWAGAVVGEECPVNWRRLIFNDVIVIMLKLDTMMRTKQPTDQPPPPSSTLKRGSIHMDYLVRNWKFNTEYCLS